MDGLAIPIKELPTSINSASCWLQWKLRPLVLLANRDWGEICFSCRRRRKVSHWASKAAEPGPFRLGCLFNVGQKCKVSDWDALAQAKQLEVQNPADAISISLLPLIFRSAYDLSRRGCNYRILKMTNISISINIPFIDIVNALLYIFNLFTDGNKCLYIYRYREFRIKC